MAKSLEFRFDKYCFFGSEPEKFAFLEGIVSFYRSVEFSILKGGELSYEFSIHSVPGSQMLGPVSTFNGWPLRGPKGGVAPFSIFMEDIIRLAGALGALRSNLPEASDLQEALLGYFSHCDDMYWTPVLDIQAGRSAESMDDVESGRKYLQLKPGEGMLEKYTDLFFSSFAPKLERISYDSSRIHIALNLGII